MMMMMMLGGGYMVLMTRVISSPLLEPAIYVMVDRVPPNEALMN